MESPCCQCSANTKAKALDTAIQLLKDLLSNVPDTYSGTDIELSQRKMFKFAHIANSAQEFINEHI